MCLWFAFSRSGSAPDRSCGQYCGYLAGKALADRHSSWAGRMPRDVTALWAFVAELRHDSRIVPFAHYVALTLNAVELPWEKRPHALLTADRLAEAVALYPSGRGASWRA
jgi:ParB family chromosome partitioning protein